MRRNIYIMAIKEVFIALLVVELAVCATTDKKCPPREKIKNCYCLEKFDGVGLLCDGPTDEGIFEYSIEEYAKLFQETLSGIRNIQLIISKFTKESRLPSRVFDGLPIKELTIQYSNVTRWADAEGGPAFVGLEDTLEELYIVRSLPYYSGKNSFEYVASPAQFTLGHLRKLREVTYYDNHISTLGNDWFENGPNSLEIVKLSNCRMQEIGDRAFANLPNLKRVMASSNKVEKLTRSMFPNPANHLEEINFASNRLSYLSDDFFTNMPALTRVEFTANPLRNFPETTWRPVWSRLDYVSFLSPNMECSEYDWIFNVQPPREVSLGCYYRNGRELGIRYIHVDEIMREKQRKGI